MNKNDKLLLKIVIAWTSCNLIAFFIWGTVGSSISTWAWIIGMAIFLIYKRRKSNSLNK